MVEGYVDVIAMVTAGFEAAVAPLGTALTEDQLALLWKMARRAGALLRRRQRRPRAPPIARSISRCRGCKPGKSLKFALLPEGQDPDDLVRSGGREAVAEVLGAARPLAADAVDARDRRPARFDTPERRAALEARINEITAGIGDETVRKYYRQDFAERLRAVLRAGASRARRFRGQRRPGRALAAAAWRQTGRAAAGAAAGAQSARPAPGNRRSRSTPYLVAQPAAGDERRCIAATAPSIPPREALILQAVLNHPWLLHDHLEELAELEFRHADAERLKGGADRHRCP